MIFLDTDHLTLLKYPDSPRFKSLVARMEASPDQEIGTTIVSVEEQFRGWLAVIARSRDVARHVAPYRELGELLASLQKWTIVAFDEPAASEFSRLRSSGVRIGTMDLKIASITLIHGALLLSANLADFRLVPGLRVENWLD
jgi:tRNA(fMet)-specific endonuclease VapC